MWRLPLIFVLFWGGLFAVDSRAADPTAATRGLAWQSDLHTAHKVAVKEKKPLLLVFGADWCGFCKKLEQTTLEDKDLVRYVNSTFVPVHLDADKDERICEILEVSSLPCTVILTPDADLLDKFIGYLDTAAYQRKLVAAQRLHARLQQTAGVSERP
jgi:thioredoxin-like negative regulator of GroEL